MASKEERDRRRAERLAAERAEASAARRRVVAGYIVAGVLGLAVLVGVVIVVSSGNNTNTIGGEDVCAAAHVQPQSGFLHGVAVDCREGTPPPELHQADLQKAAAAANCDLQLDLKDEGNTHITKESDIPDYGTNPPTSGNHNPEQLADGAYKEYPQPWYFVHSLEHGRIEFQYSPKLPEEDQLAIKGLLDSDPDGMLMFPNPDMPYEVAATAWTQLVGCKTWEGDKTLDVLRDFRDIYRGNGPEAGIPISF
jgi:hypothetical protein